MRAIAGAALLLTVAACGSGQEAEDAVARTFPDPSSARFQSVREAGDHVCGEVNGKEADGRYGGYRRFVFDQPSGQVTLDAGNTATNLAQGADDAACRKPDAYQTVAERLGCASTADVEEGAGQGDDFEELWARACS